MTDTPTTDVAGNGAGEPVGTLEHLDPATLEIGDNVRDDASTNSGYAAMLVRRDFVKKLLARKTPPKGAAVFIASCLARDSYLLTGHNALATTAELLGVDSAEAVAKLTAGAAS